MMNKDEAEDGGVDVAAAGVAPAEPGDDGGDDKAHEEEELDVVPVLPADDGALAEVGDVCDAGLAAGLDEHPADVGVVEALVGVVRVELGVGVAVVGTVAAGPPLDGALARAGSCEGEGVLEGDGGVVGAVSPEAVVACGDAEAGDVVVEDGEEEGLALEGRVVGADEADEGGEGEEEEGDPGYFRAPVAPLEGGEGLLVGEGVGDVVVGDVDVGGGLVVGLLRFCRRRGRGHGC